MANGMLVRGVFRREALRFAYAETTELCRDGVLIHDADPVSAEVLCELLTSAALVSVLLDGEEKYSVALDYREGKAGRWLADTDRFARVRALPGNTRLAGEGDREAVFGQTAGIRVLKFAAGKILNSGECDVAMASPAQDLAMFFCLSDQVETEIRCAQVFAPDPASPVRFACGMMLQALPDCDLAAFGQVRDRCETPEFHALLADGAMPAGRKLRGLAGLIGLSGSPENFHRETEAGPVYHCGCTPETMKRALLTLGRDDLEKLFEERGEARMECRFCRRKYVFKPGEV